MRRMLTIMLIALCIGNFTGCQKNDNYTEVPEKPATETIVLGEGNVYSKDFDQAIDYKYSICYLQEDIQGADTFNLDIKANIEKIITEQINYIESGELPVYDNIKCEVYEFDELYSFVFSAKQWIDNFTEYEVYHFDAKKGTPLSASDLLALTDIDFFEEYLPAAVKAGKDYIKSTNEVSAEFQPMLDDALKRMELYAGQYPVYPIIKADGKLEALVPVASLAGPDYIYRQLPLDLTITKQ